MHSPTVGIDDVALFAISAEDASNVTDFVKKAGNQKVRVIADVGTMSDRPFIMS